MYLIIFTLFFLQSFCVARIGIEGVFFDAIFRKDVGAVKQLLEEKPGLVHAKLETDKKSPLHIAAIENCCQIIEILIKAGADIEDKDNHGNTPLHAAVSATPSERSYEAAELLINLRAKVNQRSLKGKTPLNIAAEKNDLKAAKLLVKANANPNAKDNSFNTPLSIAKTHGFKEMSQLLEIDSLLSKAFFDAIRLKEVEKVKQLLEEDPKLVHAKDEAFEDSPLHVAIQKNCYEIVKILLERRADIEDEDLFGETPLHLAVSFGSEEIIDLLIEKEADINKKNKNGNTPLHYAVLRQNKKIVLLLLQAGAKINKKNNEGKTPLDEAKEWENVEIIKILEKHAALAETKTDLSERMTERRPSNLLS